MDPEFGRCKICLSLLVAFCILFCRAAPGIVRTVYDRNDPESTPDGRHSRAACAVFIGIYRGCVCGLHCFFVFSLVFLEATAVFFVFVYPELSEVGDITLTCAGAARSPSRFRDLSIPAGIDVHMSPFPATDGSHCSPPHLHTISSPHAATYVPV